MKIPKKQINLSQLDVINFEVDYDPAMDDSGWILSAISSYSNGLTRLRDKDLYSFIVRNFKAITGARAVFLIICNDEKTGLFCCQTSLSEQTNDQLVKLLGRNIVGLAIPIDEEKQRKMKEKRLRKYQRLSETAFGLALPKISTAIEKLLSIDSYIAVSLIYDEQVIGSVMLAGREVEMSCSYQLLLPFASVTANALELKQAEKRLEESSEWYRTIAEDIPALVTRLSPDYRFTFANNAYCNFMGKSAGEIIGMKLSDFVPTENYRQVVNHFSSLTRENPIATHEHSNINYEGNERWLRWTNRAVFKPSGETREYVCIGEDITDYTKAYQLLKESEARYREILDTIEEAYYEVDLNGIFVNCNQSTLRMLGYSRDELIGKSYKDLYQDPETVYRTFNKVYMSGKSDRGFILDLRRKDGSRAVGELSISPIRDKQGYITGFRGLARDITERIEFEEKLKYMSMHDQLTGLHNRTYFEEELNRLSRSRDYPITMISADLDDLKLVNDTLGHTVGDELLKVAAGILKQSIRESDVLARIGGDEFTAILPKTDEDTGEKVAARIRRSVERYNREHEDLPLGLSIGVATAEDRKTSLLDIFKESDDLMYRDKLYRSNRVRTKTVEALLAALSERDYVTEGHTQRVSDLCLSIGERVNLSSRQLSDLALLAQVHDLGKVGIPDSILFKEGTLSKEEWKVMRLHPEKGYRIAITSPDLSGVADLILKHHERWDGKGYPLKLEGNEIPVECRILGIVDAYDAMTNDRPYSKAVSSSEALEEIRRCAGSQFDPELVEVFLSLFDVKE
ncbi:MAG: PAS domain S-box protein [Bacillota bacterium]|nr:PAS domain S-box protein [Bacillota bacterium]